ncbi:MAG TPA: hypothetical protein PK736_03665 [Bacteroidia bacterium]|nr:hypothetical protein [Bacteroidia bacterium]
MIYPSVIWHYAQGMAMLLQNKIPDANKHLAEMKALMTDTTNGFNNLGN